MIYYFPYVCINLTCLENVQYCFRGCKRKMVSFKLGGLSSGELLFDTHTEKLGWRELIKKFAVQKIGFSGKG